LNIPFLLSYLIGGGADLGADHFRQETVPGSIVFSTAKSPGLEMATAFSVKVIVRQFVGAAAPFPAPNGLFLTRLPHDLADGGPHLRELRLTGEAFRNSLAQAD
jgi:hypothetical protein